MTQTLKNITILFLLFIITSCASTGEKELKILSYPVPFDPTLTYDDYLSELNTGNTKINYLGLRLAFTKTDNYSPYNTSSEELRKSGFELLENDKPSQALDIGNKILADNYTDMDSHFLLFKSYEALNDMAKADFHEKIFQGLTGSILSSGTGLSEANAMHVISTREEYLILNYMNYRSTGQKLINFEGSQIDVISTIPTKGGKLKYFYFNVDIPLAKLKEQLEQAKEKDTDKTK